MTGFMVYWDRPCRSLPAASGHDGRVPRRSLTRREMDDLAKSLQTLLDAIRRDEMTASTATTYRLEGAVTALGGVLGRGEPRLDAPDK